MGSMRKIIAALLAPPQSVVALLIAANVANYLLCLRAGGKAEIPIDVLHLNGAVDDRTLATADYWRLFAYGFLHADPAHLGLNMLSLLIVAPLLERLLGAGYFILVYAAALVGAGVVSALAHPAPFVTVGASGAILGCMAALFALWIKGESEISPSFFLVNFGLGFVYSMNTPRIDWIAHFGGFAAGFVACASLGPLGRIADVALKCKFPEFAKTNVLLLAGAFAARLATLPPPALFGATKWTLAAAGGVAIAAFIKALDLVLARRRGLAGAVALLALGNAAVAYVGADAASDAIFSYCVRDYNLGASADAVVATLCLHSDATMLCVAALVGLATVALYAHHAARGWNDAGFIARTLMAERRRRAA